MSRSRSVVLRRSRHIVAYWSDGQLIFHNFANGSRISGSPVTAALLDFFGSGRQLDAINRVTNDAVAVRAAVRTLVRHSFLVRADQLPAAERAMDQWNSWNPAAGFFHNASRDGNYAEAEIHAESILRARLASTPLPPPLKAYPRRGLLPLPVGPAADDFTKVLTSRRTWRRFSRRPLQKSDFGALLRLTFGVQAWLDMGALGKGMLRTSPSGGVRHPIEAYVLVRNVRALAPGLYHYAPDNHALRRLTPRRARDILISNYLPGQSWYDAASALVLLTAVFARAEWQYPYPRSYRNVLLEAGHFCQTFCLTATWLGLAPFCSSALADSEIEHDLGLDGISESVVYACGVGTRQPGTKWAPWPDTSDLPRLLPPKSAKARHKA